MLPAHWTSRIDSPQGEAQVEVLVQHYGLAELLARILVGRGISAEHGATFLQPRLKHALPDPLHLHDMNHAATRIADAIEQKETIALFGDYDVDGATSSALMARYLEYFGCAPIVYIPDRMKEGYGPNAAAFELLLGQGVSLIITLDCGTVSYEPITQASDAGSDVIVIDHHMAQAKLPDAFAVINPNRLDQDSDCGHLAAVGVAFLTLVAVNRELKKRGKTDVPDLLESLDLVALGTICDVVALTGLNRAFVSQGLKVMAARNNLGCATLSDIAQINEPPNTYHVGFLLGPRINAGGRVGASYLGSQLLRSNDAQECEQIARTLDTHNRERQVIEQMVREQAEAQAESQVNQPCISVASQGWHEGVIGIVAGRLKERYDRPAMVISMSQEGIAKGSARSVPGADIGAAITAAKQSGLLLAGGGHAMAAGFSLELPQLSNFNHFMTERLAAQVSDYHAGRKYTYDAIVTCGALSLDSLEVLAKAEPFGMGNPSPRFVLSDVELRYVDRMKEAHLRLTIADSTGCAKAVCFNCVGEILGDRLERARGAHVALAGQLKRNRWQGRDSAQFIIDEAHELSH